MNYVSWGDAARFANWLHNGQPAGAPNLTTTEDGAYFLDGTTSDAAYLEIVREPGATWAMPSEDEWYKAAAHLNDGATGNYFTYAAGKGIPSNELIGPDPGNNATFYDDGYTVGSPYYRTKVGAHEQSASAYGTFDQGGNLWEWNEAMIDGTSRGCRGGSFSTGALPASYRSYDFYPANAYNDLGFRVCKLP